MMSGALSAKLDIWVKPCHTTAASRLIHSPAEVTGRMLRRVQTLPSRSPGDARSDRPRSGGERGAWLGGSLGTDSLARGPARCGSARTGSVRDVLGALIPKGVTDLLGRILDRAGRGVVIGVREREFTGGVDGH